MAKIGLNNFRYAKLVSDSDGKYSYEENNVKKPGKAVSCKISVATNDATQYADDGLNESDYSFNNATVTMEIDEDDPQTMADLLGHTVNEKQELVRNEGDTAPYVGLGRVVTKMVNGVYKYKAEILNKVKFTEPSQEDTTEGDKVDFATVEIEGVASSLSNGDWSRTNTFDDKENAIAYLEKTLGKSGGTSEILLPDNGGHAGTQEDPYKGSLAGSKMDGYPAHLTFNNIEAGKHYYLKFMASDTTPMSMDGQDFSACYVYLDASGNAIDGAKHTVEALTGNSLQLIDPPANAKAMQIGFQPIMRFQFSWARVYQVG